MPVSPNLPAICAATILPNIGGWASVPATRQSVKTWYKGLNKPSWTPPEWAFGPVWTCLYSSMGYASYLVYKDGGGFNGAAKLPLILYGTQLAANWAWSPIFFIMKKPKAAFYDSVFLTASAGACGCLFFKVNQAAGLMFIPYMMWLGLATCLNYRLWKDNEHNDDGKGN